MLDSDERRKLIHDHSDEEDEKKTELREDVAKPDFFTNNFDFSHSEDVINQIKNKTSADSVDLKEEPKPSHILIQGDIDEEERKVDFNRGLRTQQQIIPTEYHGAPVSPASIEGGNNEFRI